MSSRTVFAGTDGCTARMNGPDTNWLNGVKSFAVSNGSLLYMLGTTACPADVSSSVYPSGADLATISVPMIVPAPGRASSTIGWPHASVSFCATGRATTSTGPPGGYGITHRMGFAGYASAANALHDAATAASSMDANAKRMIFPLIVLPFLI